MGLFSWPSLPSLPSPPFGSKTSSATGDDFEREAFVHFREIYRAALRLVRQSAEAEDLCQEVFLQAWRSFGRFEPGTNCRAWLYQILWNVHHQRLRKKAPLLLGAEGEARLEETLAAREETPTSVTDEDVAAALEALSPEHRNVVLLCDVEGFTYKEIATVVKVPIGTVMSRLSRARSALRGHLHEMAEKHGIASGRSNAGHSSHRSSDEKSRPPEKGVV